MRTHDICIQMVCLEMVWSDKSEIIKEIFAHKKLKFVLCQPKSWNLDAAAPSFLILTNITITE